MNPLAAAMPWNLVAPAYADEVMPTFEAFARDALALAPFATGARVVDVACGPGTVAVLAARAGARVDAVDFSPAMIELLAARVGTLAITPRIGDAQALPYESGTFAAAFSMFSMMFIPDRAKAFAELRRVLAPGARAVISTWPPVDGAPVLAAVFGTLRAAMATATGKPPPPEPPTILATEETCRAEMGAVFRDVEVHRMTHVQRFASAAALWDSMQRTLPPAAMIKQALGDKFAPVSEAVLAAIANVTGAGEVELPMAALLTVGIA